MGLCTVASDDDRRSAKARIAKIRRAIRAVSKAIYLAQESGLILYDNNLSVGQAQMQQAISMLERAIESFDWIRKAQKRELDHVSDLALLADALLRSRESDKLPEGFRQIRDGNITVYELAELFDRQGVQIRIQLEDVGPRPDSVKES